jgi:hypothetical protein
MGSRILAKFIPLPAKKSTLFTADLPVVTWKYFALGIELADHYPAQYRSAMGNSEEFSFIPLTIIPLTSTQKTLSGECWSKE